MFLRTTGGGAESYSGVGIQPSLEKLAAEPWHGALLFRKRSERKVRAHFESLSTAEYLTAEISELAVL